MYIPVKHQEEMAQVASLAREIWTHHFGPMVDQTVLAQIIEKVQSREAIAKQIEEGHLYYLIHSDGAPVGYFAYCLLLPQGRLFLSKLYILSSERGKGSGRQVVRHLEKICRAHPVNRLSLTVHRKNKSAIRVYESCGFNITGTISRDIGNGIVLEDFEMEKAL